MGLGTSTTGKMTKEELDMIRASWSNLMKNPEQNGILIFKRFMETYEYYSHFKKFAYVPLQELPNNPSFRKHAISIVQALNNVILRIGSDALIKDDLTALGKAHRKRNVTEQQFRELKNVIVEVIDSEFSPGENCLAAWNKILDIAFLYVFEGLRDEN